MDNGRLQHPTLINVQVIKTVDRDTLKITNSINQRELTDIYITFHPNRNEYYFYSTPQGIFSKIEHILINRKPIQMQED